MSKYSFSLINLYSLYDPKKPDVTRKKQDFKLKIQQLCTADNVYHKYRRDRREMLDMSYIKGSEYKKKKEEDIAVLKLHMRLTLYGAASLTRKERAKLRQRGILPSRKQRVSIQEEHNKEFVANDGQHERVIMSRNSSRARVQIVEPEKENMQHAKTQLLTSKGL